MMVNLGKNVNMVKIIPGNPKSDIYDGFYKDDDDVKSLTAFVLYCWYQDTNVSYVIAANQVRVTFDNDGHNETHLNHHQKCENLDDKGKF